jgi:4-amino-4-deoxy-L-arabinose transferase-like glycosyltransferase
MTPKRSAPAARAAAPTRALLPALMLVLLLAAFLRLWKIDSPVGGFHAFNEAFYVLIAKNFFHSSLLAPSPDGHGILLQHPPLYPYLVHAVFRIAGESVVAARLVSVAASLGLVLVTFFLGRELYGPAAAMTAAVFLAVAPMPVLTGRNIQTDSTFVFLMTLGAFLYVRAGRDAFRWAACGAAFGLAVFTKLFTLVIGPAFVAAEIVAAGGFSWLREKGRWIALATAAVLPGAYYGYQAASHRAELVQEFKAGAGLTQSLTTSIAELPFVLREAFWGFSPAVAVLSVVGVVAALWRLKDRAVLLALCPLAAFAVFCFFVHKHSYYLLTLLPWSAVLAGRALSVLPRVLRGALLVLVAVSGAFVSAVDLCSMKLGFSEFASFGHTAADLPGDTHLYRTGPDVQESYGTVVQLYDPKARLLSGAAGSAGPEETWLLAFVPPQARIPSGGWLFERERYGLELFGFSFAEAHENANFFSQGRYLMLRTGAPSDFGLHQLKRYPALALAPLGGGGP